MKLEIHKDGTSSITADNNSILWALTARRDHLIRRSDECVTPNSEDLKVAYITEAAYFTRLIKTLHNDMFPTSPV